MGVTGDLLSRILRTAGRKLDLSTYKDGIIDSTGDKKRQRTSERRPIRIGFDVGCLVARAAHGLGSMLLDERHLTNYGRSLLQEEEETGAPVSEDASRQALMTSAENKREYVDRCTGYVMQRIQVLRDASGGQILVVFDGATPPIKEQECMERSNKRKAAAKQRDEPLVAEEEALVNAKRRVRAARRAGAGSNHGDIVCEVLQALRRAEIPFLVAPYEADGQLAYMAERGMIDLVVTEDSDLIAQGCQSILYKTVEELAKGHASGTLVQREDLGAIPLQPKGLSLLDFSDVMLAVMFVALGCDYCSSLRQIGSVAARDIVRDSFLGVKGQSKEERDRPALEKVFEKLYRQTSEKDLTDEFKAEYEASFLAALLMYRHPMIYDPFLKRCVLFRDPPHCSDPELMDYEPYAELCSNVERREQILGTCYGPITSTHIAEGWISPRTKRPYKNMVIPAKILDEVSSRASDTEVEDEASAETQDIPSAPSVNVSQVATEGPDTQDASHFETQMETQMDTQVIETQVDSQIVETQVDTQVLETQVDTQMVETQVGHESSSQQPVAQDTLEASSRYREVATSARTITQKVVVTYHSKKLGVIIHVTPQGFAVEEVKDCEQSRLVETGDILSLINGLKVEAVTIEGLKQHLARLPRPVKVTYLRKVSVGSTGPSAQIDDEVIATDNDDGAIDLTQCPASPVDLTQDS